MADINALADQVLNQEQRQPDINALADAAIRRPSDLAQAQTDAMLARPRRRFEDLQTDPQLIEDLRAYFDMPDATPGELVDRFIGNRVWRDTNTLSAAHELVESANMTPEERARLARIRRVWEELPYFWQPGGRGVPGLIENVVKSVPDPVNFLGGPIARGASWLLGRGIGRVGQIGIGAGVDAAAAAGMEAMQQSVDVNTGEREGLSLGQIATAGALGGATGAAGSALFARSRQPQAAPLTEQVGVLNEGKIGERAVESRSLDEWARHVQQQTFDRFLRISEIQQRVWGVGSEPQDLVRASETAQRSPWLSDPAQLPYFQFRNLASSWERANQILFHGGLRPPQYGARLGTPETDFRRTDAPAILDVLRPVHERGQLDNFFWYLAAVRARFIRDVRHSPMRTIFDDQQVYVEAGFDPDTARQLASRAIDDIIAEGERNGFNNLLPQWNKAMRGLLEYQRDAGLLSDDDVRRIWGEHLANPGGIPNTYIPFYRADRAASGFGHPDPIRTTNIPGRARMEGGTGNVQDWRQSIIDYVNSAVAAADRNLAKLSLYDTIDRGARTGVFRPGEVATRVNIPAQQIVADLLSPQNRPRLEALLRSEGINTPIDQIPQDQLIRLAGMLNLRVNGDTDIVFRNGKMETWRVTDPELLDSLKSLNPIEIGRIERMIVGLSRMRNNFITLNPAYVLRNFIRDAQTAPVNSVFRMMPVIDSIRGFRQAVTNQELVREAFRNGMGHANQGKAVRDALTLLDARVQQSGDVVDRAYAKFLRALHDNYVVQGAQRGVKWWQEMADNIESAHRLAEYILARRHGLSGPGAAFLGREVATDFGLMGSNQALRRYSMHTNFFNAGIQGFYKLGRTIYNNPERAAALTLVGLTLPDLAMHVLNAGHPEYEDIPSTLKAMNVFFPVPPGRTTEERLANYPRFLREWAAWKFGQQTEFQHSDGQVRPYPEVGHYIMLPKAYDYGAPGTIVNGLYDWFRTNNMRRAGEAFIDGLFMATPGANTPWWVTVPYQLGVSGADWLGRSIVPRDQAGLLPDFQGDIRTSELAKQTSRLIEQWTRGFRDETALGRGFEVSPYHIDYLINYFSPGIAQIPIGIIHEGMRGAATRYGPRPERRVDESNPFNPLDWFVGGQRRATPLRNSEAVNRLLEMSSRARQIEQTHARFATAEDLYRVLNLSERPTGEEIMATLGFAPYLQETAQAVRLLGDAARHIEMHPTLSAEQKRQQVDYVLQQRNELARAALAALRQNPQADPMLGTWLNPRPSQNIPTTGNAPPFLQAPAR